MANKSKAKGTAFETSVTRYINGWVGEKVCERVVLHGNKDHGDLCLTVDDLTLTVEAKWRKSYPSRSEEIDFRRQTITETANAGTDGGILVVNRFRQSIGVSEVWMDASTWLLIHGTVSGDNSLTYGDWAISDWGCMRLEDFCYVCFGKPRTEV